MPNTTLKDESVLWSIYSEANALTEAKRFSKHSARDHVIAEMAAAYQIDPDSINRHEEPVLYTNVSKIIRLIFPKHARAAANLRREIARGDLPFNDALEIARGNAQTREDCRPQQRRVAPPPRFELGPLFSAVIAAASQAGYDSCDIVAAFNDALDEHDSNVALPQPNVAEPCAAALQL
jgi:hypothetical protein